MRISEISARNNSIITGLNKFAGMQYSEKTKLLIIQHINFELSKTIDINLNEHIQYDIVESFGKCFINPNNLFTSLIFNGKYYPQSINKDKFEVELGTFFFHDGNLYFEERPIEEVRELRLNRILKS